MGYSGNDKHTSLLGAGAATALATLISRVVGLARDASLAAMHPKEITDIFWAAFRVPNTFRNLFGEGASSVAFIPTFTRVRKERGEEQARALLNAVLRAVALATGAVTLAGVLLAPWIVRALLDFPPQLDSESLHQDAVHLVRWMFPYLILACLAAVIGGALNATGRFFAPAMTSTYFNLSIVLFSFLAVTTSGVHPAWLAAGVLVGGALQVATQLPSLWRAGFPLGRLRGWWTTPGLGDVFTLFFPATLSLGVKQINTLVNTNLASALGTGPISYLFYADRVAELPLGIFGFAIATAAFPRFSQEALEEAEEAIRKPLIQSLKGILLVMVPSTVGLWILGGPILDTLFNRGRFAAQGGLEPTLLALRVFVLGLVPFASVKLIGNLSYSLGNGRAPVIAGLASAGVNLVLAYSLRYTALGHAGLALAVVCASVVNMGGLLVCLRTRVRPAWFLDLVPLALRALAASAGMGVTLLAWIHWSHALPSWSVAALGTVLGGTVYCALGALLFREQLARVIRRRG